ncbi:aminopeptidase P family protein [soil metagenome]
MDTLEQSRAIVRARIASLRTALAAAQLDAWIVPSADPHLSEYLPGRWQGRQWLSGFTGSVGTLVVTAGFAGVWVDGRYWAQAEAELAGTGIELMKVMGGASATPHVEWLADHLHEAAVVGVDGQVLSLAGARGLQAALAARGMRLRTDLDLLDSVWTDRPDLPAAIIYPHPAPHDVVSRADKLAALRQAMRAAGASHHWISTLDDLAWLTNLRGSDVSYNPIYLGHALIGLDSATLFVSAGKLDAATTEALAADGVTVAPYEHASAALSTLPAGSVLLIDPRRVTLGMREAVAGGIRTVEATSPTTLAKSRKTPGEIAFVRRAMEHDGAALCEFFAWFEQALGHETITELTIDERITAERARQPGYVSPSFGTIAALNANGAMPHYRATSGSHATISKPGFKPDGLLLIDSGGQYHGGTTDITRVVPAGEVSQAQRRDYTRVLKGMIALSRARFPRGTRSPMLDSIARAPIWEAGCDYGHGTGHGVGYFLNVHEGPHGITPHLAPEPQTAMEPGMITSNEPGIYRPGRWGIRIENLVANRVAEVDEHEFGEFLEFETLTLCPIDTRCIAPELMRDDEIGWLDDYHAEVRRRLAPLVTGEALRWLHERTEPF